jgi:tetratricopeptide (TPR) repeat protein
LHDISKLLKSIVEKKKGKQIDDITDTFVLREIAGLHKKLGALKKAKAILQRAYELNSEDIYTLSTLAGICKELHDYEEGISHCRRALEIKGDDYVVLNALGALYKKTSQLPLAMECYRSSLYIKGNGNFHAHTGLGAVYVSLELYNEAELQFKLSGQGIESYIRYLRKQYGYYKDNNMFEKAKRCWSYILKVNRGN